MTKLAGEARAARKELSVGENGRAYAFGDGDQDGIANALHAAEPELGQHAGVGVVVHLHLQLQRFLQSGTNVEVFPVQVRRQQKTLRFRMDAPRHAYADSLKRPV